MAKSLFKEMGGKYERQAQCLSCDIDRQAQERFAAFTENGNKNFILAYLIAFLIRYI